MARHGRPRVAGPTRDLANRETLGEQALDHAGIENGLRAGRDGACGARAGDLWRSASLRALIVAMRLCFFQHSYQVVSIAVK